ncbi:MAG: hypothetical protein IID38_02815 [Planctomycetes bacterium]|nr:hypothetical protein [Planctomycetota bacterium]
MQVMQVRIRVMLGLVWVLGFTSINAVGQETFSGCGLLLEGENGCWAFFPDTGGFFKIKNIGSFGHFDYVYVSIIEDDPCGQVGKCLCKLDNTIEQCPECGDGLVGPTEECDDQDLDDGDGCSSICAVEEGFFCTGEPSVCNGIPAISTWGAVILTLLLLSAGTICLRRRTGVLDR